MGTRRGFTLLEVMVTAFVVLLLLAVFLPVFNRVRKPPRHNYCGTNLKGLGTAMIVYANDYDGAFPQLPGEGPWAKELGFEYDSPSGPRKGAARTISASMYLLVREADVSPKSFVCPYSPAVDFDGDNPENLDITQLWDFGSDPYRHVSYSMQNPYGKYAGHDELSADFAVAADMSPWFVDGDFVSPAVDGGGVQIIKADDKETWGLGNSWNHPDMRKRMFRRVPVAGTRNGQNVLFGDGHNAFEKRPNVGMEKDNIYTFWSKDEEPSEQDRQGGTNPTARDGENDAKNGSDSFLAI